MCRHPQTVEHRVCLGKRMADRRCVVVTRNRSSIVRLAERIADTAARRERRTAFAEPLQVRTTVTAAKTAPQSAQPGRMIRSNSVGCADNMHTLLRDGFLYPVAIMGCQTRKLSLWRLSNNTAAVSRRPPGPLNTLYRCRRKQGAGGDAPHSRPFNSIALTHPQVICAGYKRQVVSRIGGEFTGFAAQRVVWPEVRVDV